MFKPTHIVQINSPNGIRAVALQRVQSQGELEIFRDVAGEEFHQWGELGVSNWPEYQIRALESGEAVRAKYLRPIGPPAVLPYRVRGLASFVAEPAMQTC